MLFETGAIGGLTDGELLDRFVGQSGAASETAFGVLVERHGPMVLRVCRNVLRDPHDAQDAFQATFLVLVRKADSIRSRDAVGSWLFGVACRVASTARAAAARRRSIELRNAGHEAEATAEGDCLELGPVLREEIDRLPESQRAVIVLCYLEGLTHEQAAQRLGLPVGTVRSRLARGRERLRGRLVRRGLAPVTVLLGLEAGSKTARAALPCGLVNTTVRGVLRAASLRTSTTSADALANRVVRAMLMNKLIMAVVTVALLGLGVSMGIPGDRARPGNPFGPVARADDLVPKAEPIKLELIGRTAIDPDTMVKVRPRFDASVEKVYVVLGEKISKMAKLVDLNSKELAAAKSDYQSKYVQWKHDNDLLEVRRDLVKTGAISKKEWVDTQNDEMKSKLDYRLAEDKLRVFKVPDEDIKALRVGLADKPIENQQFGPVKDKAKITLLSPADGIVIDRDVVVGNFYDTTSVLMTIAPLDHLWVWSHVFEKDHAAVKVGQRCEVQVPLLDSPLRGKVEHVGRVDPVTHTARVRMTIPNPDRRFRPDIVVRVMLLGD